MTRPNSPFGVLAFLHWNHHWNNWHFNDELLPKAVLQLKELGVGFIRMDILWSDVHAGLYQYNFERYDRLVSLVRSHGIDILGLLHYNRSYVDSNGETWNKPPDSIEEFAAYVEATVQQFKDQIQTWEIWNEPNHPVYWNAPPDDLKRYCDLLRLSYKAVKSADPRSTVLNGGLTHPIAKDVRNLYQNGGKDIFDILSIHPFLDPLSKDPEGDFDRLINEVCSVMKEHNDERKKIWITEMGCPGVPPGKSLDNWFQGKSLTEEQQSQWLETQFNLLDKYPAVEKIFWAFYRDTDGIFKDGTDFLGLVRFDLNPKPAFQTFKNIIARQQSSFPRRRE